MEISETSMAATKRPNSYETGSDSDDNPKEKRMRPSSSFRSVIVEVMKVKCLQAFCGALEPLLRRVVNEELNHALRRRMFALSRAPSLSIKGDEQLQPSNLKLNFTKRLNLPIFTGGKILDCEGNPLRILLISEHDGQTPQENFPCPLKIELVAIDGDFCADGGAWRISDFEEKIIREREGKRPLLAGDLAYTMRDGLVVVGDIKFTDNSSWIRGRKFRIGARVVAETSNGIRILEAVTEAFIVRDHRGELYKKHHPPELSDEVWRLEKIGKDGTFHNRLADCGIKTVQDFLMLYNVDLAALKKILGPGMSDKMWKMCIDHARTCNMDKKVYVLRGRNHCLAFNSTCQVLWGNIDGTFYSPLHHHTLSTKAQVEELVKFAYENWSSLEEEVEAVTSTQAQMNTPIQ